MVEVHWKKNDGGNGFIPPDHPRDCSVPPKSPAPPSSGAAALKALASASSSVVLLAYLSVPHGRSSGPHSKLFLRTLPLLLFSAISETFILPFPQNVQAWPRTQLSQHQLLITIPNELPCSSFPTFQARWSWDMMRKNLGLFSCLLPRKSGQEQGLRQPEEPRQLPPN